MPSKSGWWSSIGNHRYTLRIQPPAAAAQATVLWRRPDANALQKDIVVSSQFWRFDMTF